MNGSKRGLIKLGLAWNVIAWALVVYIIWNTRVLGDVVFIAESDVWVMFIGGIGGVILTVLMAAIILRGGRSAECISQQPARSTDRW